MRNLLALATALALAACGHQPPEAFTPEDVSIQAPPDQVWTALLQVYTDLNIPIENIDRDSWFLRSERVVWLPDREQQGMQREELFDCGNSTARSFLNWPAATQELPITHTITTLLVPQENGATEVRTRVNAVMEGFECASTGVLEQRVLEAIEERM